MIRLLTGLLLCLCSVLAQAEPDAARQYFSCRSCHGDNAQGSPAIHAPALAGQSAAYLARQLRNFQDGSRGAHPQDKWGTQMALMAANLDSSAIEDLSQYISTLPSPVVEGPQVTTETATNQQFSSCIACHGVKGGGNSALGAPSIAGLDRLYLATQLRNFRDGIRGSETTDSYGQQMRAAVSRNLDNKAIDELARYIEAL